MPCSSRVDLGCHTARPDSDSPSCRSRLSTAGSTPSTGASCRGSSASPGLGGAASAAAARMGRPSRTWATAPGGTRSAAPGATVVAGARASCRSLKRLREVTQVHVVKPVGPLFADPQALRTGLALQAEPRPGNQLEVHTGEFVGRFIFEAAKMVAVLCDIGLRPFRSSARCRRPAC